MPLGDAIGGVLHEVSLDQISRPIGFFSRRLSPAERNYSVFDRELLAIYAATIKFRHLIEGKYCVVFTDQKPIISSFTKSSGHSPRQTRQLSFLSEFIDDIQHLSGCDNVVADTLSRPSVGSVSVDIFDLPAIAAAQDADFRTAMKLYYTDGCREMDVGGPETLLCDNSVIPRPILPDNSSIREAIFRQFHNLSHANWRATCRLIVCRFTWPQSQRDIKKWARDCLECQRNKVTRHTKPPRGFADIISSRFTHVHMDIVGPLPPVSGSPHRYIVTFIDRGTNWVEAEPIDSITAEVVAFAFIRGWFSRFGVPLYLTTDRGSQFESELFSELSKILGFVRLRTTSYHPQANGKIERYHRVLKSSLMASQQSWIDALPIVVFGHRITSPENGFSPHHLVTGSDILLPSSLVEPQNSDFSREFVRNLSTHLTALNFTVSDTRDRKEAVFVPTDLSKSTHVWLRVDRTKKSLEAPYSGPHKVVSFHGRTVEIEVASGTTTVSLERVKPCYLPSSTSLPNSSPNSSPNSLPNSIHPVVPTAETVPASQQRYCRCDDIFDEDMIACDHPDCHIEWFHLDCVGLTPSDIPDGDWFCPSCRKKSVPAAAAQSENENEEPIAKTVRQVTFAPPCP